MDRWRHAASDPSTHARRNLAGHSGGDQPVHIYTATGCSNSVRTNQTGHALVGREPSGPWHSTLEKPGLRPGFLFTCHRASDIEDADAPDSIRAPYTRRRSGAADRLAVSPPS